MSRTALILAALITPALAALAQDPNAAAATATRVEPIRRETLAEYDARMKWFSEARLGMFIHWGLYSQAAGEWRNKTVSGGAEWIQSYCAIPTSEYAALVKTWNPVKYDPEGWVRMAKAAGLKYVCITTKHHDGFCLWPTRTNTDWSVRNTPFARDLLKPLADACRREGLRFCIYHSIPDWRHRDWPGRPAFNDYAQGPADKERYKRDYLFPQLRELFTEYGDIGMIWLDDGGMFGGTGWSKNDGMEVENLIRSLQPQTIIDDRSGAWPTAPNGAHHSGDYGSPEFGNPDGIQNHYWEACWTLQAPNNWGFNSTSGFRSSTELIRHVVSTASLGGNLLLNVGPTADGEFPPQSVMRLNSLAQWMRVNAEAIHGSAGTPFGAPGFDGRVTRKPGHLYLHLFSLPPHRKLRLPLLSPVSRATLLADRAVAIPVSASAAGVTLDLPASLPDPIATVIDLAIEGEPQVIPQVELARGKSAAVSSVWANRPELAAVHLTDGKADTVWAAAEQERSATVTLDLGGEHRIDRISFSDLPFRRTRAYSIEAFVSGAWRVVGEGRKTDASGNAVAIPDALPASRIRITVKDASDTPVLSEISVTGQ